MTTEALVAVLKDRGLRLLLSADGRPVLRGPKGAATPALLRVVALHRDALTADALAADEGPRGDAWEPGPDPPATGRQREYLFADGRQVREPAWLAHRPPVEVADWWRFVGEARWRAVAKQPLAREVENPDGRAAA